MLFFIFSSAFISSFSTLESNLASTLFVLLEPFKPPGKDTFSGNLCFSASLITTNEFLGPGTDPFTKIRFSSSFKSTIVKLCMVFLIHNWIYD